MKNIANLILGFITIFLSLAVYGQGPYLSGSSEIDISQKDKKSPYLSSYEDSDELLNGTSEEDEIVPEAYVPFSLEGDLEYLKLDTSQKGKKSPYLSNDEDSDEALKAKSIDGEIAQDAYVPTSFEGRPEYLKYDASKHRQDLAKKGKKSISFIYFPTAFEDVGYINNKDTFNEVFVDGNNSKRSGTLIMSSDYLFYRGGVDLAWGVNLGFAFNSGDALFVSDKSASSANLKLWVVPVDLSLSLGIPIGSMFKIGVIGGPSVMGLFQNRSDFEKAERGKRRRQVSVGYFGGGRIKFSLSKWTELGGVTMYDHSSVTNFFLTVEGRYHSYSNFQDDIKINGSLFGIGLTYEYL